MFSQEPFQEYKGYFNVHRIDVVSVDSGASHPEFSPPLHRNTALGAYYSCDGVQQRLLCVSETAVNNVLSNTLSVTMRDFRIVLVNDPTFGGSSGTSIVLSNCCDIGETVL